MTDWQAIETAPRDGEFLAPNKYGDWLRVRRFDTILSGENAVINERTGKWWTPNIWTPLPPPPEDAP